MLTDAEATARVGAEPPQRIPARRRRRNGHRDKPVSTNLRRSHGRDPEAAGQVVLPVAAAAVPPGRQSVARGDLRGLRQRVSTRKFDDLAAAFGIDTAISIFAVSDICKRLNVEVAAWRHRPLNHPDAPTCSSTRRCILALVSGTGLRVRTRTRST